MNLCVRCGAPAVGNDPSQGGPVCLHHAASYDERDPEMRQRIQATIEGARAPMDEAWDRIAKSRRWLAENKGRTES